ncbi:hypothetical protein HZS_5881, partial [Henneguya salminicola]
MLVCHENMAAEKDEFEESYLCPICSNDLSTSSLYLKQLHVESCLKEFEKPLVTDKSTANIPISINTYSKKYRKKNSELDDLQKAIQFSLMPTVSSESLNIKHKNNKNQYSKNNILDQKVASTKLYLTFLLIRINEFNVECKILEKIIQSKTISNKYAPLLVPSKFTNNDSNNSVKRLIDSSNTIDFTLFSFNVVSCFLKYVYAGVIEFFLEDIDKLIDLSSICGCEPYLEYLKSYKDEFSIIIEIAETPKKIKSQSNSPESIKKSSVNTSITFDGYQDNNLNDYYTDHFYNRAHAQPETPESKPCESSISEPVNESPKAKKPKLLDLKNFTTPELKGELNKYGIRPLPKKRMIDLLEEIVATQTDFNQVASTSEPKGATLIKSPIYKYSNEYSNAISQNDEILTKILTYEPLNIKHLQEYFKTKNIKATKKSISEYLNSQDHLDTLFEVLNQRVSGLANL